MNKIIDTLSPNQDTLLNNGLLILPQAQDFFNLVNNFNNVGVDEPTKIWQDFYQPSYPVVIVQLLGWVRLGNPNATPILKNSLVISAANRIRTDVDRDIYGLAIRINYPNNFSTPCARFRRPIADLVYSLEFTPLFSDYTTGIVTLISTPFIPSDGIIDALLRRGETQNLILGIGESSTTRPDRRTEGFWEIRFVADRDDINVLYTDANGLYLEEDDVPIINEDLQQTVPNVTTLFVPQGELGQDFYCNITTADVRQPADVIRIIKRN